MSEWKQNHKNAFIMREIIELINEMSPYLLLGFLLAGVMHAFVPATLYRRYLGGRSFRSVFNAAMLGIPLPLCSCGVIPTAMSLRREGASRGATVSFLIATPQTGVDSIIATYSLMGLPFALVRPLAALVTALLGGCLVNLTDKEAAPAFSSSAAGEVADSSSGSLWQKVERALHYAFVEMMQDIGRWLLLGLVIAGLITVFVPDSFFALFADNSLLSMLLVLTFAVPMYLCATGSIPIAMALMLKGLSPGTALVLLMAGPAVNAASMLVISKVMGRRTLFFYLLSIVSGAVGFGLVVDWLLPREWFTAHLEVIQQCCHTAPAYFNVGCSLLLVALLVNAFVRRYRHKGACACCHTEGKESDANCEAAAGAVARTLVVHIKGMSCNHCRTNVERAIASLPEVDEVQVELSSGKAVITGSPDKEALHQAVESLGFEVSFLG